MYKVSIESLSVKAIIGILDFERLKPQEIIVDCFIEYEKIGRLFINYAEVVSVIEKMLVEQKYELIEDGLEDIIETLCKKYSQIQTVRLKLSKSQILENCVVGVELFRKI